MKIEVSTNQQEIIIRKGEALAPKAQREIVIDGTLSAPSQFLQGREPGDLSKVHLRIYKDLGKLELYIGDTDPYTCHKITGSLKRDSGLNQFAINYEKRWTVRDFIKFIRTMRYYFSDKEQHAKIIESLQKWTAKIERVIKEHNDNSGNSLTMLETKVMDVELVNKFDLEIPIFQGYPKQKFKVLIGLDPKSTTVDLFLFSDELIELELTVREATLENELKSFDKWGFSKVVVS